MKSPIFSKEKLLYFPQKSSIVPIFRKIPSSYISYFGEYTPCGTCALCSCANLFPNKKKYFPPKCTTFS